MGEKAKADPIRTAKSHRNPRFFITTLLSFTPTAFKIYPSFNSTANRGKLAKAGALLMVQLVIEAPPLVKG